MLWSGWGDPQEALTLAPQTQELVRAALGVTHATKPVALEQVQDLRLYLQRRDRRYQIPHGGHRR